MSGCEEIREILLAVARGATVSAGGRNFLRDHSEQCPECGRTLASQRMLTTGLAALASVSRTTPSASIRDGLLVEFRRNQKVVSIRRPMFKWAALTAAAGLSLFAIFETARQPAAVSVAAVDRPPIDPNKLAVAAVSAKPDPAPEQSRAVRRRRLVKHSGAQPERDADETAEAATDFFQIPYAEPLRPEERADVVRIEMPRANMAVFGLPVEGGRLDSRITADVLMGEDGVARAVRFIH